MEWLRKLFRRKSIVEVKCTDLGMEIKLIKSMPHLQDWEDIIITFLYMDAYPLTVIYYTDFTTGKKWQANNARSCIYLVFTWYKLNYSNIYDVNKQNVSIFGCKFSDVIGLVLDNKIIGKFTKETAVVMSQVSGSWEMHTPVPIKNLYLED